MLETHAQIVQQIKGAKRVLITCQKDVPLDSLASCLALQMVLKKMGIPAEVVVSCHENHLKKYAFLPGLNEVTRGVMSMKTLVVRVIPEHATVGSLSYERSDGGVIIYLTPDSGTLQESDVKIE